ncbi:aldose 1-epimerase [Alcanivorax hongdengensis A-11-3]|uniref:Putative glucose-6-phosphate 1-epimerase n=1 Tax=Alcanivorax hongdengensis A-11-3 TaxID=1177179 RepID=L0W8K9_9GAMM|nr:D-hexose-6-phosphate mutarotase [Alcanivorax hongdengensis]EKF73261.1 aldose 1-epimerase [Alcanivorax hongdengensis A-11-3]
MQTLTRGELDCVEIHHRGQRLVIADQGAQVLEYQRDGEPPLIWLSDQEGYRPGQSVRGGVPVCWPWFGALTRNPATLQAQYSLSDPPAHGLVRGLPWQRIRQHQDDQRVQLVYRPASCAALPAVPTLTVTLDDALTLSLHNHNPGSSPVWISQALHSYFAVGDIHRVSVQGLDGCPYVDAMDDWQRHTQDAALTFKGETDRLYLSLPNQLHIDDARWQRRISLSVSGSRSAVIWNPWVDKSRRLSQFADNAWQGMLCIETARVLEDALCLAPGEQHEMAVRFVTEAL